jgi:hypothetical protein
LTWYEAELEALKQSPIVNVTVYVTSTADTIVTSQTIEEEKQQEEDVRRSIYVERRPSDASASSSDAALAANDLEASLEKELGLSTGTAEKLEAKIDEVPRIKVETKTGRPDITKIVETMVKGAHRRDIVAVGACGPAELMRVARNAVADNITVTGPSITLHCEQFGWG